MIIAVASPPGAGKTHWICQQIAQINQGNRTHFLKRCNKSIKYLTVIAIGA